MSYDKYTVRPRLDARQTLDQLQREAPKMYALMRVMHEEDKRRVSSADMLIGVAGQEQPILPLRRWFVYVPTDDPHTLLEGKVAAKGGMRQGMGTVAVGLAAYGIRLIELNPRIRANETIEAAHKRLTYLSKERVSNCMRAGECEKVHKHTANILVSNMFTLVAVMNKYENESVSVDESRAVVFALGGTPRASLKEHTCTWNRKLGNINGKDYSDLLDSRGNRARFQAYLQTIHEGDSKNYMRAIIYSTKAAVQLAAPRDRDKFISLLQVLTTHYLNMDGMIVRFWFGDRTATEGLNIYYTSYMAMLTLPKDYSSFEQASRRTTRTCSMMQKDMLGDCIAQNGVKPHWMCYPKNALVKRVHFSYMFERKYAKLMSDKRGVHIIKRTLAEFAADCIDMAAMHTVRNTDGTTHEDSILLMRENRPLCFRPPSAANSNRGGERMLPTIDTEFRASAHPYLALMSSMPITLKELYKAVYTAVQTAGSYKRREGSKSAAHAMNSNAVRVRNNVATLITDYLSRQDRTRLSELLADCLVAQKDDLFSSNKTDIVHAIDKRAAEKLSGDADMVHRFRSLFSFETGHDTNEAGRVIVEGFIETLLLLDRPKCPLAHTNAMRNASSRVSCIILATWVMFAKLMYYMGVVLLKASNEANATNSIKIFDDEIKHVEADATNFVDELWKYAVNSNTVNANIEDVVPLVRALERAAAVARGNVTNNAWNATKNAWNATNNAGRERPAMLYQPNAFFMNNSLGSFGEFLMKSWLRKVSRNSTNTPPESINNFKNINAKSDYRLQRSAAPIFTATFQPNMQFDAPGLSSVRRNARAAPTAYSQPPVYASSKQGNKKGPKVTFGNTRTDSRERTSQSIRSSNMHGGVPSDYNNSTPEGYQFVEVGLDDLKRVFKVDEAGRLLELHTERPVYGHQTRAQRVLHLYLQVHPNSKYSIVHKTPNGSSTTTYTGEIRSFDPKAHAYVPSTASNLKENPRTLPLRARGGTLLVGFPLTAKNNNNNRRTSSNNKSSHPNARRTNAPRYASNKTRWTTTNHNKNVNKTSSKANRNAMTPSESAIKKEVERAYDGYTFQHVTKEQIGSFFENNPDGRIVDVGTRTHLFGMSGNKRVDVALRQTTDGIRVVTKDSYYSGELYGLPQGSTQPHRHMPTPQTPLVVVHGIVYVGFKQQNTKLSRTSDTRNLRNANSQRMANIRKLVEEVYPNYTFQLVDMPGLQKMFRDKSDGRLFAVATDTELFGRRGDARVDVAVVQTPNGIRIVQKESPNGTTTAYSGELYGLPHGEDKPRQYIPIPNTQLVVVDGVVYVGYQQGNTKSSRRSDTRNFRNANSQRVANIRKLVEEVYPNYTFQPVDMPGLQKMFRDKSDGRLFAVATDTELFGRRGDARVDVAVAQTPNGIRIVQKESPNGRITFYSGELYGLPNGGNKPSPYIPIPNTQLVVVDGVVYVGYNQRNTPQWNASVRSSRGVPRKNGRPTTTQTRPRGILKKPTGISKSSKSLKSSKSSSISSKSSPMSVNQ